MVNPVNWAPATHSHMAVAPSVDRTSRPFSRRPLGSAEVRLSASSGERLGRLGGAAVWHPRPHGARGGGRNGRGGRMVSGDPGDEGGR